MARRKIPGGQYGPPRPPIEFTAEELCDAARAGDKTTARELLKTLCAVISPENKHPVTGEPLPVPLWAREYLAEALRAMAYNQVPGDKAFYLNRKGGGDHWTHADKRLAADLVEQFAFSQNLEEARAEARNAIPQIAAHIPPERRKNHPWRAFIDRVPSEDQLKDWHAQFFGRNAIRG